MQSLYNFIIKPVSERYLNKVTLNNKDLIVNTKIEDHSFVSKKAHIISVTGDYTESINRTYWKIEGDVITQYLNKKMTKVFDTYKIGITENDDWKIKWTYYDDKNELVKRGVDTFTEKTYKITYELTLIE